MFKEVHFSILDLNSGTDEFSSDDEHNKESEKESKKSKNEIVSQSEIVSADAPKYCFSLTTWFSSPDLGMTDFEVLMRSSAFTIKSNSGNVCKI